MNTKNVLCGLVLGIVCVVIPSTSYAQATSDNASVTAQLNDAKTIVAKIKKDAVQMESYAQNTGLSWQTHSTALEKIKADVNDTAAEHAGLAIAPDRGQSLATGSNRSHNRVRE